MGIKSRAYGSGDLPPKPYPKLMVNSYGVVVLFKNKYDGVVVHSGTITDNTYKVGTDVALVDSQAFKDYNGSVDLENT